MKKTVITALIFAFVLGLSVSAMAYDINDTTLVQPWRIGAPTGGAFVDVIGAANVFDTFGADVSGTTLTIYTNWFPGTVSISPLVVTADLFLDTDADGFWNYGIQLDTLTGTGNVLNALSFSNADLIFSGTGFTYGGLYDPVNFLDTAVKATGAVLDTTSVVWTAGAPNKVDIDLTGLVGSSYNFFYGTATCANDGFAGDVVPVPASLLLLGSGLLGLVGLGARKKNNA